MWAFSGARRLSLSIRTLRWCLRSRTRPSTTTSLSFSTPLGTPPTGGHSLRIPKLSIWPQQSWKWIKISIWTFVCCWAIFKSGGIHWSVSFLATDVTFNSIDQLLLEGHLSISDKGCFIKVLPSPIHKYFNGDFLLVKTQKYKYLETPQDLLCPSFFDDYSFHIKRHFMIEMISRKKRNREDPHMKALS